MTGYTVTCSICGHVWSERDPNVSYVGGEWFCYDEPMCFERHAAIVTEFTVLMAD